MWTGEQRGVVALDPRLERERDRREPGEERHRSGPRDRRGGMSRVDPPHADSPDDDGRDQPQPDERIERPAEQQVRGCRRLGRDRAVGEGRRRPGEDRAEGHRQDGQRRPPVGPRGRRTSWNLTGPSSHARGPSAAGAPPLGAAGIMAPSGRRSDHGRWPQSRSLQPDAGPRAGVVDRDRGQPMSSRPGARPSSGTIFAGLVAVILPRRGRRLDRPQRAADHPVVLATGAGHDPGPGDQRPLHDRLHHRGDHLLRRRGADRLDGDPVPAPAG